MTRKKSEFGDCDWCGAPIGAKRYYDVLGRTSQPPTTCTPNHQSALRVDKHRQAAKVRKKGGK